MRPKRNSEREEINMMKMSKMMTMGFFLLSILSLIILSPSVDSFQVANIQNQSKYRSTFNIPTKLKSSKSVESGNNNDNDEVIATLDVSDLGLTMEDLNKPLPPGLLSKIERSGYQSTSRLPDVNDNGCYWIENNSNNNDINGIMSSNEEDNGTMDVTLCIPGLRGQPAASISALFSTTTVSIAAFGRVVWSCIVTGKMIPDECSFLTEDGQDMVPVIQLSVEKENKEELWGRFILQVGEDSIL